MATLSEDEITRLHRIRKTVMEMLRDRGYEVTDVEVEMTRAQFIEEYGSKMKRNDLTITKDKGMGNSSDKIYVFFPDEDADDVKSIKTCFFKMNEEDVKQAILVVKQELTPIARACISHLSTTCHLEVFQEAELLINVQNHVPVPKHRMLSPEEKHGKLQSQRQLPRIREDLQFK